MERAKPGRDAADASSVKKNEHYLLDRLDHFLVQKLNSLTHKLGQATSFFRNVSSFYEMKELN